MPLFTGTHQQYYENSNSFTTTANQANSSGHADEGKYVLGFSPAPTAEEFFIVYVNGTEVSSGTYTYATAGSPAIGTITFTSNKPVLDDIVLVKQSNFDENLGNYQFITLKDIINNFMVGYVGPNKIVNKVRRADVAFHAQRAIQELSYDTFRSSKAQEIDIPPSLTMALPHDYVNYIKCTFIDNGGLEHIIYPTSKTSNPQGIIQAEDYTYSYDSNEELLESFDSETWNNFQSRSGGSTTDSSENLYDYQNTTGSRYGGDPASLQVNGLFYIDNSRGKIHFSSSLVDKTIILHYISDSLGTDAEMIVHKLAEEAMYKSIAYAILSTKFDTPETLVQRYRRDRFASVRNAKLRLSNLKIEELTRIMRGKSKHIKH
jgi:hypothetical protein